MIDLAEWVAGRIYALQIASLEQWLLRGLLCAAGLGAAYLSAGWVGSVILTPWWVVTLVLLLCATLRPDSLAPLLALVPVILAWLGGGGDASWWRHLAVATLVSVFHLLAAWAAAAPSFAVIRGRAARRMLLSVLSFVCVTAGAAGALAWWSHRLAA